MTPKVWCVGLPAVESLPARTPSRPAMHDAMPSQEATSLAFCRLRQAEPSRARITFPAITRAEGSGTAELVTEMLSMKAVSEPGELSRPHANKVSEVVREEKGPEPIKTRLEINTSHMFENLNPVQTSSIGP